MMLWLIGSVLLIGTLARLAHLVALDGLGSTCPPRSHVAELGTRADRELRR